MYHFKINEMTLNSENEKIKIAPKKINVIIGPNNSGKSRLLKELRDSLCGEDESNRIIDRIDILWPNTKEEFIDRYDIKNKIFEDVFKNKLLRAFSNKSNQDWNIDHSYGSYFERTFKNIPNDWVDTLARMIENQVDENEKKAFLNMFGALVYQYLGTEDKLTICKTQKNYGLDSQQTNFLMMNKFEDATVELLAENTRKLFGRDIIMDRDTLGEKLVFRTGDDFSGYRAAGRSSTNLVKNMYKECKLDDEGDGIKSFVSTYLSIKNKENDILLLDEPESFLHPPLARQVGEIIGDLATEEKQIFIATHSVEVLKGIMTKCDDLNIIRITRSEPQKNVITQVDKEDLDIILKTPILRVSRVLEGLFCEKVIITEAEADEIVYQELIEKTFSRKKLYFAHSQNKQSIPDIASMYKKIGVEYVMLTDFDVLYDSYGKFFNTINGCNREKRDWSFVISELKRKIEKHIYEQYTAEELQDKKIKKEAKNKIKNVYHTQGIRWLNNDEELKLKVAHVLKALRGHNIFILPWGELETILEPYGVGYVSQKNHWIGTALERIGEMTEEEVQANTEVYDFLAEIANA